MVACGQKADSCKKKKLFKKDLYYCGQLTGVAPAWISLHALLPGRPILIQYCAINTFTVQGGLYKNLTVIIQMKATDWYIPDCEVPFIIGLCKVLLHVTFEFAVRNEVQKGGYKNVPFKLY